MPLSAKVGKFECPAAGGSSAVTGVGFQPKALILWCANLTADGTAIDATNGIGFGTGGAAEYAIGSNADDAAGVTSDVSQAVSNAGIVYVPNVAATARILEADLTSLDSDGFTLNWTTVISGVDIHYLALGGASLTNALAGNFVGNNLTGNQGVTGVGFQPDVIIFLSGGLITLPNDTTGTRNSIGAAVSSTQRWSMNIWNQDAVALTNAGRRLYAAQCLLTSSSAGTVTGLADFVSFDTDGFTVNWSNADNTNHGYLALKGVNAKVGTITQKTSAGSQATTGMGFAPTAVIFASHGSTDSVGTLVDDLLLSFGATTGAANEGVVWAGDNDNVLPTTADCASSTASVIQLREPGTTTINAEADTTSLDADGWTLNWSTADATARVIGYVALGPAGSALAPQGAMTGVGQ